MGYIELAPEDRDKFGVGDKIPFEYGKWGLRAINALEAEVGLTVEDLHNGLRRQKTIKVPADDGSEVNEQVPDPSSEALAVVVWLALWSVGKRIPWDSFDVQPIGLTIQWSEDEQGKAEEPNQG